MAGSIDRPLERDEMQRYKRAKEIAALLDAGAINMGQALELAREFMGTKVHEKRKWSVLRYSSSRRK